MSCPSIEDVYEALNGVYETHYGVWGSEMPLPCITYMESGSMHFCADNTIYKRGAMYTASLFTSGKDVEAQGSVLSALLSIGCIPSIDEMPVSGQGLFRTDYEFSTIGV